MKEGNKMSIFSESKTNPDSSIKLLTKREYFIGLALQGLISSMAEDAEFNPDVICAQAVQYGEGLFYWLNKD